MAIQEIEKTVKGSKGIGKGINSAANGLVMEIAQSLQYTKPIPSTVRELTSNAIDSQLEKQRAIEILTGKAKPSDFFVDRNGELYEDSKWDASYFNLDHLSSNNSVDLVYEEGEGKGRADRFTVTDYGVGIGLSRLAGSLSIGYSTKRNRKDVLGVWGLGAKAGLSTGTDFYVMETVHNGLKYRLKIFNRDFYDLVGKFNEHGLNEPYHFYENDTIIGTVYGEKVDVQNYTRIEIPVLKHCKSGFDLAVKTQLMFFNNVTYKHRNTEGIETDIDFLSDVHYNSNNLIVADNVPFNKPYIVIVNGNNDVGVNYGYIEFEELELEQKFGSVGIKCNIRQAYTDENGDEIEVCPGLDVLPSREGVRWSANTKNYLLSKFEEAQNEASSYLEKSLQETDFLQWISKCRDIVGNAGRDKVLGKLSGIIELSTLQPKFNNTDIKYQSAVNRMFDGFKVLRYNKKLNEEGTAWVADKTEASHASYLYLDNFYVGDIGTPKTRVKHLFLLEEGEMTYLEPYTNEMIEDREYKLGRKQSVQDKFIKLRIKKAIDYRNTVLRHILKSSQCDKYSDVVVPDEFIAELKEKEDALAGKVKKEQEAKHYITPKERRELNKSIVVSTYIRRDDWRCTNAPTFKRDIEEPTIQEVLDFNNAFYGFRVDEEALQYASHIVFNTHKEYHEYNRTYNKDIRLCSISKTNKKHFANHKHINSFFGEVVENETGTEIIMNKEVVNWNTARNVYKLIHDVAFLNNWSSIDSEIYDTYKELKTYISNYHFDKSLYLQQECFKNMHLEFTDFLDKLQEVQIKIADDSSNLKETLSEKELPEDLNKALSVDIEILDKANQILNYVTPLIPLLNTIPALVTTCTEELDIDVKIAIEEYVQFKLNQ